MSREEIKRYLHEEIEEVRKRFSKALLRVENAKRREAHLPELPKSTPVYLPEGRIADLYLLTLEVWRLRYCVSADFIIDSLLTRFRYARRLPPATIPESLDLGLYASTMAGIEARKYIEERITKDFPNKENIRVKHQQKISLMPELEFETIEQMLEQYNQAVQQEQARLKSQARVVPTRAYRKVHT